MSAIGLALLLSVIAGCFNGSWGTPPKYMKKWKNETIWFSFSFFAFLVLPWLTLLVLSPEALNVVFRLPSETVWTMVIGGLIFGLSQAFFAIAFKFIGVGINYVINISMGTAGSALVPFFWHRDLIGTDYFHFQILGVSLFVIAVVVGAIAGAARDKNQDSLKVTSNSTEEKNGKSKLFYLMIGVILSILAGVGSACEGIAYIFANPTVSKIATDSFNIPSLPANIIAWVILFSAAWIPFALYFLILVIKNKGFSSYSVPKTKKYWFLVFLMGCGFWGGLVFFSKASIVVGGSLAPMITWPLFMVFIILVSNFWSWITGEWNNAGIKAKSYMWGGILLFIVAIGIFSYSSGLKPEGKHKVLNTSHIHKYMNK